MQEILSLLQNKRKNFTQHCDKQPPYISINIYMIHIM
jgi:hypothetical protein